MRAYAADEPLVLLDDPVEQWLDWEEQANLVGFRTDTRPVWIEVASVPRAELETEVLPGAPPEVVARFVGPDRVCFPRHPLNRDASVAWMGAPVVERWQGRFTASRTLALPGPESGAALCSLKLATDHPHPDVYQPEKTRLREEAMDAARWVRTVDRIDRWLGPRACAELVLEALVVLTPHSETGFVVRDLRSFQDGHHYLPALSLPWVGRQIAARHGEPFETFWETHFASPVGRAKAELLARYGLWYETPNPQNVLLQLDRSATPTGRLVFRDLGDGECATDAFGASDVPWTRFTAELRPETENSFWAFGEAAGHSVPGPVLERWYAAHDAAYFAELSRWFPELAPADSGPSDARGRWNAALRSPRAPDAVASAFRRRRATHALEGGRHAPKRDATGSP